MVLVVAGAVLVTTLAVAGLPALSATATAAPSLTTSAPSSDELLSRAYADPTMRDHVEGCIALAEDEIDALCVQARARAREALATRDPSALAALREALTGALEGVGADNELLREELTELLRRAS